MALYCIYILISRIVVGICQTRPWTKTSIQNQLSNIRLASYTVMDSNSTKNIIKISDFRLQSSDYRDCAVEILFFFSTSSTAHPWWVRPYNRFIKVRHYMIIIIIQQLSGNKRSFCTGKTTLAKIKDELAVNHHYDLNYKIDISILYSFT